MALMPWATTVAMATPGTPIGGTGPSPRMKMPSRMMLRTVAIARAISGVLASPRPRRMAPRVLYRKRNRMPPMKMAR
ncbi:MAG: hypothetical protein A6D92_05640 [Symbiobacterium thermophilum]|uniref:Uncharacterized protein n=1 Tax=Symbiobacterium thermophilum TaxID=2734 RepID=A0A1Y2T5I2_SYMTR|nr:MAG: hypothetical protein A6D92_05640 [Symbiobacterium thermophilum]